MKRHNKPTKEAEDDYKKGDTKLKRPERVNNTAGSCTTTKSR